MHSLSLKHPLVKLFSIPLPSAVYPNSMSTSRIPTLNPTERSWAIVASDFVRTGGMDVANVGLASRLASQTQVDLVTHRLDEALKSNRNVKLHLVPRPLGIQLLGETRLKRAAAAFQREHGAKNVTAIVNGGNCFWPNSVNWVHYVHAAFEPTVHGSWLRRLKAQFHRKRSLAWEKKALHLAKMVICNSDLTRKHVIEMLNIPADRTRTVYYGIDAAQFRPSEPAERIALRQSFGWHDDAPRVLFVGALGDRRKGFDTLASAWEMLCSNPSWSGRLVVVGIGAELKLWQERFQRGHAAGTVDFLGFRKDVANLMKAADALVAPTRYEAYGLGVHEAICCGLATFVSAESGVGERFPKTLDNFLLQNPEDAELLAEKLLLWKQNRQTLGDELKHFSVELRSRSWDDMADEIIEACSAVTLRDRV
jgi:glycosyltransferase involved in cell wall biosynthesis